MTQQLLICGATGFIGRNLVAHFAANPKYRLRGTYNGSAPLEDPRIEMVKADLTNAADVANVVKGTDILIQAAATTSGAKEILSKPYYHVTDNAVMNSLLCRAAFEYGVKHVLFFSCTVMYPSSETPLRETDFDANAEMYSKYFGVGWTKVYVEKTCEFFSRISDTRYTVFRHSNIYGPHDKYDLERSHVFGATVTKALTATDGRIVVWGKGNEKRDLLYVSDLVRAVDLAIENQESPFELLNIGSGEAVAVKDLVSRIVAASGRDLRVEHDLSKPSLDTALCLDCSKAERAIGWRPKVGLDEGIAKTIAWYRENII